MTGRQTERLRDIGDRLAAELALLESRALHWSPGAIAALIPMRASKDGETAVLTQLELLDLGGSPGSTGLTYVCQLHDLGLARTRL